MPEATLPCHIPGYIDPCPDCPLDECAYGTSTPGADEYDRRKNATVGVEDGELP
jgi:hypothetical protein